MGRHPALGHHLLQIAVAQRKSKTSARTTTTSLRKWRPRNSSGRCSGIDFSVSDQSRSCLRHYLLMHRGQRLWICCQVLTAKVQYDPKSRPLHTLRAGESWNSHHCFCEVAFLFCSDRIIFGVRWSLFPLFGPAKRIATQTRNRRHTRAESLTAVGDYKPSSSGMAPRSALQAKS